MTGPLWYRALMLWWRWRYRRQRQAQMAAALEAGRQAYREALLDNWPELNRRGWQDGESQRAEREACDRAAKRDDWQHPR